MKLLQSQLVRYILTGGLSFAIELAVLLTLISSFGMHRSLAVSISFWISLVISFLLQKLLAFEDRQRKTGIVAKQALFFVLLVAFNYLFTIVVVALFPDKYLIFSRTLAIIIVSIWNYYVYKNLIFNRGGEKSSTIISPTEILKLETYIKLFHKHIVPRKKQIVFFLGCSAIVVVFFLQYIVTGSMTFMGDFDYYSQLYEALRISILEYGQFPAWNPWMAGGIPLWQNPQFGLFSIQSVLAILFGTVIGIKLAYIAYALLGFWGMYLLSRRVFNSERLRAVLVSYIWVFSGFFAGHNIAHFTFTSFFLLPWVIYCITTRKNNRYAWLGLGVTLSVIALSSVHYATMFTPLIIVAYFALSLLRIRRVKGGGLSFAIDIKLSDMYFAIKSALVFILLAGWQFLATYRFVSSNERLTNGGEVAPTIDIVFQAIFMPVGTLLDAPKTTWGWGEYNMYIGFATLLAILLICWRIVITLIRSKGRGLPITNPYWVIIAVIVGITGVLLALGDYSNYSPFHILHMLPGFSQTRVPSRWVLYAIFALLLLIASWRGNKKTVNTLLVLSVIELFVSFGPLRFNQTWIALPQSSFPREFSQYDNDFKHTQRPNDPMNYYLYTTSRNTGQIYADDSLINTLSSSPLLKTSRCAANTDSSCRFIRTGNAELKFWSPNKIIVHRTGPGIIRLNMNSEAGWRINNEYPYALNKKLDPSIDLTLPEGADTYTLEYAPKLSPSWITWKLERI